MPNTAYFGQLYVTPFDPAYIDLWATPLNNQAILWDAALGRAMCSGCIPYPAAVSYGIVISVRFPCTIKSLKLYTDTGTLTAESKIGSTAITGLSAVAVTSTPTRTNASAANVMAADDNLFLTLSAIGATVTMLYYSYWIDRTGAGTA